MLKLGILANFWSFWRREKNVKVQAKSMGVSLSADGSTCNYIVCISYKMEPVFQTACIPQFYCLQVCILGFTHSYFYSYQIYPRDCFWFLTLPLSFSCVDFFFFLLKLANFLSFLFSASIFHYGQRICEWLCSSKLHRCHNPQSPPKVVSSFFHCTLVSNVFFVFFFCGVVDLLFK